MTRKITWLRRNLGVILMLSCVPLVALISTNYFGAIAQNLRTAVLIFLVIVCFDALAVYARTHSKKVITHAILIIYILSMGVLFIANLTGIYTAELGTWAIYLLSVAFYFVFGFEYNYTWQQHHSVSNNIG